MVSLARGPMAFIKRQTGTAHPREIAEIKWNEFIFYKSFHKIIKKNEIWIVNSWWYIKSPKVHEQVHALFATLQKLKPQVKGQMTCCMKQKLKKCMAKWKTKPKETTCMKQKWKKVQGKMKSKTKRDNLMIYITIERGPNSLAHVL